MSKQKQWEVERHMRRHWEQLQRARQKGHRDAEGRAMSSWRPGELVRRERSRRRELDERRRIQQVHVVCACVRVCVCVCVCVCRLRVRSE
jgi:hypothetical protein